MISIIIIVGSDQRINTLLSKLSEIEYPEKHEIIVIDKSNGFLNDIRKKHVNIQWYEYKKNTRKKTYAEQRNLGIKKSKGKIIVFIDSDCIPDRKWLVKLLDPIYKEGEKLISGKVKSLRKDYIHVDEEYNKYRDECPTMNMAINREVINAIGFFDEKLEGAEDSDYCIRAKEYGYKIRYVKEAYVYHDWGGFKENIIRSFNGGKDRICLYKKYNKQFLRFSSNNLYTLYYVCFLLFLPMALFYPLYLIILIIPSIIKRRNPVKEIFNLAYSLGFLKQLILP